MCAFPLLSEEKPTFRGLLTASFERHELALSPSTCFRRRHSQTAWAIAAITTARQARARCRETGKAAGRCLVGQITLTHPGASRGSARRRLEPQTVIRSRPKARGRAKRSQLTAAWRKSREQRQRRRLGHALGEQLAKEANMARDEHNEAAQHHENAAKAHRSAAEHHGKGDHAKGKEHSNAAMQHSQTAHQHSDKAHSKSQQQK